MHAGGDGGWTWGDIVGPLADSRHYWMATTGRDGGPHSAPVWGVVLGADLYVYSSRDTAKARNLAVDPRVVVHLESAEHVLIVRGTMLDVGTPADWPDVVAALDLKYPAEADQPYLPSAAESVDVVWRLVPTEALGWNTDDYEESQRRWQHG